MTLLISIEAFFVRADMTTFESITRSAESIIDESRLITYDEKIRIA